MPLPTKTRALIIREAEKPGDSTYHDAIVVEQDIPALKQGEVLVEIRAAGFNHRELWTRMGLYPGIVFGATLGADGAGIVVGAYDDSDPLLNKRVFLTPARGWEKDPVAPESRFGIVGGGNRPPIGTFSEYVVVERDQVVPTPAHLSDIHAAAWPLGGLTAWRALMVLARVEKGQNVLITGIGGGVALIALQLAVAKGANVYVTSGTTEKIHQAVALGAKGGVKYKDNDWPQQLAKLLKRDGQASLDSVIDSAGGDIMGQTLRLLKQGGKVVCYGMTAVPKITFRMPDVMRNVQLLGSMMGSHQDLLDATAFMEKHRIIPVVSDVLEGIDASEEGFDIMKRGIQFGKIVVQMNGAKRARL